MITPQGVPLVNKDKHGTVSPNPNVAPLCLKEQERIPKGVPRVVKDKKGTIFGNPNVAPLGAKKQCAFGGKVSNVNDVDIIKWNKQEIIPKGVPRMVKDKKGAVFENPNVAPLGSKKQCTFGGLVSNVDQVSIIKWHN